MTRLVLLVLFVGLAVGALMPADFGASHPDAPSPPVHQVDIAKKSSPAVDSAPPVDGPWTTLTRDPNGHFFARALVNGQSVDFMVDTGASGVALTEEDARRIGLPIDPNQYRVVGSGASGPVYGQLVTLDRVALDNKTVENVSGAVLADSEISLLGQSFLSRMGKIEISSDRMIIR